MSLSSYYQRLARREIEGISRYFDEARQLDSLPWDDGSLTASLPTYDGGEFSQQSPKRTAIIVNGNFNYTQDLNQQMSILSLETGQFDRVVALVFNPFLVPLFRLLAFIGWFRRPIPGTFLRRADINNLARLWNFEVTRYKPFAYFPWHLGGLGEKINSALGLFPLFRWLGFACIVILRPIVQKSGEKLSVIVPARNEAGNVTRIFEEIINAKLDNYEVVFVEGNSTDATWDELVNKASLYGGQMSCRVLKQPGKGKADAVDHGIRNAGGELIVILDADLTVAASNLPYFLRGFEKGAGDLVNGNRLLLPRERGAMRFLNWLGNLGFARLLRMVSTLTIGDSLCGSKLFLKNDYFRFKRWLADAKAVDPFGDFQIILPAGALGIGAVDVPVRYFNRTYGTTNIRRFRDGLALAILLAKAWLFTNCPFVAKR